MMANAQESMDALQMGKTELSGTARYQSMAGAFGALGGDVSTLNQNPGGIGVYRSSDVSFTGSVNFLSTESNGSKITDTNVTCPSIGYVGAFNLNSDVMPNLNVGFTYGRQMDYRRHYSGNINSIGSSITNHIAQNTGNFTESDLTTYNNNDPYYKGSAPWISILSYNSYLINRNGDKWQGLYGTGTSGYGEYEVDQSGYKDEYTISIGGNIKNTLYWGASAGFVDMNYNSYMYYGEDLKDAQVSNGDGVITKGTADLGYEYYLNTRGTGYNFKFGVILKPVNEIRIGAAFHTPTYFDLKDEYKTYSSFEVAPEGKTTVSGTNETGSKNYMETYRYRYSTPWRFIGSIAGVIGRTGIISVDYEYVANQTMRCKEKNGSEYIETTENIKNNLQASHIIRVGGELRVTPSWSLRAGYSYQTSPVSSNVKDNNADVATGNTYPSYEFDNSVQYITAGVGYHYQSFYMDLAYVHKYLQSQYNAFSPNVGTAPGVYAEVKDHTNRIVCTLGFRF